MADKISKVIIDIISRGGANAAAEINKVFKDAVAAGASQEKFEQRQALQRDRLATQSADKQKKLDQDLTIHREKLDQQTLANQQKNELQREKIASQSFDRQKRLDQQNAQFVERMAESRRRYEEKTAQAVQRAHERLIEKRIAGEQKAAREAERQAKAAEQAHLRTVNAISGAISNAGNAISTAGRTMTAAVTVPLTALGALGTKTALDLDGVKTKLTALEGGAVAASQKILSLYNLADNSVGVLRDGAVQTYVQLKGIGGIADETISKFTAATGKLNAAFKIDDLAGFNQNLNQIFTQGFERSDIKEAIGRVPFFEQLLESAFGTKDGEKLRKLKDSGKLTLDGFLSGMSDAINSDPRIANIQENLATKLAKGFERLNIALAPIGEVILRTVVPALETISPYILSLSNWFAKLSPVIQTVIVGIGAFVAALGPLLVVAGGIIAAIGSIVTGIAAVGGLVVVAKAVAIAIAAIIGAFIQLGPVVLLAVGYAVLLYKAWETNFGGIRDFTIAAWETVKSVVSSAMTFIYGIVQDIGGALVGWWRENYPLIELTIANVSVKIRTTVQSFLAAVQQFWETHGARITAFVKSVWDFISTAISTVVTQIGNIIRLGLQIYNRDWEGAWKTLLKTFQQIAEFLARNARQLVDLIKKAFEALLPILFPIGEKILKFLVELAVKIVSGIVYILATLPQRLIELVPKLIAAGMQIGQAIWEGVRQGLSGQGAVTLSAGYTDNRVGAGVVGGNTPYVVSSGDGMVGGSIQGRVGGSTTTTTPEETEKQRKEREKKLKEEIQNLQNLNKEKIEAQRILFEEANRKNEVALDSSSITWEKYKENALKSIADFKATVLDLMEEGFQLSAKGKSGTELDAISATYKNELARFTNEINAQRDEVNKKASESEKKSAEERIKTLETENNRKLTLDKASSETRLAQLKADLDRKLITEVQYEEAVAQIKLRLLETEKSQLQESLKGLDTKSEKYSEITTRIAELDEALTRQQIENATNIEEALNKATEARDKFLKLPEGEPSESMGEDGSSSAKDRPGIFDSWIEGWRALKAEMENSVGIVNIVNTIGDAISNMVINMTGALGQAIEGWALYGDSIGKALRKAFAAELAHIAGIATIKALYATALGFLRLAEWDFVGAGNAFASAALWGALAVGTALAAKAVAPKNSQSFQSAATQATNSNSGSRGSGGSVYSGYGDDASVENIGANDPSRPTTIRHEVVLKIKEKTGWLGEALEFEVGTNTKTRQLIIDTATG